MGLMFVPFRLEIKQAPQYIHFPLSVMFGATKIVDGNQTLWTALYEPDFSLYEESDDGSTARMFYHNRFNRNWLLVIVWKNINGEDVYNALKFSPSSKSPVFETDGSGDWDRFFTQLTAIGVMPGETCKISPVTEIAKHPQSGSTSSSNAPSKADTQPTELPPVGQKQCRAVNARESGNGKPRRRGE